MNFPPVERKNFSNVDIRIHAKPARIKWTWTSSSLAAAGAATAAALSGNDENEDDSRKPRSDSSTSQKQSTKKKTKHRKNQRRQRLRRLEKQRNDDARQLIDNYDLDVRDADESIFLHNNPEKLITEIEKKAEEKEQELLEPLDRLESEIDELETLRRQASELHKG